MTRQDSSPVIRQRRLSLPAGKVPFREYKARPGRLILPRAAQVGAKTSEPGLEAAPVPPILPLMETVRTEPAWPFSKPAEARRIPRRQAAARKQLHPGQLIPWRIFEAVLVLAVVALLVFLLSTLFRSYPAGVRLRAFEEILVCGIAFSFIQFQLWEHRRKMEETLHQLGLMCPFCAKSLDADKLMRTAGRCGHCGKRVCAYEVRVAGINPERLIEIPGERGPFYTCRLGGRPKRENGFFYGDDTHQFCFFVDVVSEPAKEERPAAYDLVVHTATAQPLEDEATMKVPKSDLLYLKRNITLLFRTRRFIMPSQSIGADKPRNIRFTWSLSR